MYTLSSLGESLIKNEEGLRLVAYICPAGKLTIGYGHRIQRSDPRAITKAQAEDLFRQDVTRVLAQLWKDIKTLRQNQVDALVCFIFNIGLNAWLSSTARRDLLDGHYDCVPHELRRWIHDDHMNVIKGLVIRREKEIDLWEGGAKAA
ncbi:MAG: lysozyme [Patescibacteria group bacterium]|nr:lysozyme [Patescibacteria group bacterium]